MLATILPEHAVSSKIPELDPAPHEKSKTDEGTLVIRLRLSGIDSVEILADQSETQARLLELWSVLRPAVDVQLEARR